MLAPKTPDVAANAIFVPQILFQTPIVDGALKTSVMITFAKAVVAEDGTWMMAGPTAVTRINDLLNLAADNPDLAGLQDSVMALYLQMVALFDQINTVRNVL